MPKRAALGLIAGLLFAAGLAAGSLVRSRLRPLAGGPTVSPGEVEITMASSDVPGCFAASAPFRAVIRSRWGDMWSENTLAFTWVRAADGQGIVVSAGGQPMDKALTPRQPFPPVDLQLPLGPDTKTVRLTSFVFDRFDELGRACFTWDRPPGTPRPATPRPTPLGHT